MKPDEVIYVKVFIKDAKDLPEKEGIYYDVVFKSDKKAGKLKRLNIPELNQYWLENIDYYLRPTSLRDVLKDFNSFMCGKQYDGRIPLIDTCIDEYINSKK